MSRLDKTRCFSCGLFWHMSLDCPSPAKPVCYTCRLPGHVAKDCLHGKRAAERQEWRPAKQARQSMEQLEAARGAGVRGFRTFTRPRNAGRGRGGRGSGGASVSGWAMMAAGEEEEEEQEGIEGKKMKFSVNEEKSKNEIVRFIADSGATEHHSNFRMIFETLDKKVSQVIKCANKEVGLKTEGSGEIRIR